ncbi:hypothetical protein Tco_0514458 [Tanacetum coccineum]
MRETESLNYGMTFDPYSYLTLYLKQKDRNNLNHKWLRCLMKPYSGISGSIDDVARLFDNVSMLYSMTITFASGSYWDMLITFITGSETFPPSANKENYVPWSSRLLCYAKSRPNRKLIYNSIMNFPCVRRMIPDPGDPARTVPVPEMLKKSWLTCSTQMMKGSDIEIQEKKAKLFNEWERFTSTNGESIELTIIEVGLFKSAGCSECGNQKGVIVVSGIANQNGMVMLLQHGPRSDQKRDASYLDSVADCSKGRNRNPTASLIGHRHRVLRLTILLSMTQDGSAVVQLHENCYINEIFNMFTQEEQYTELLEPIPVPHQVPQNNSNVISEVSSVKQGGGTIEQHYENVEETRAYHESLFHNLAAEVEKVNSVNHKMKVKNAKLTTELARYKIIQKKNGKAKVVQDFKSLAKEADESLAKHKALELEIERLLRAVTTNAFQSECPNFSKTRVPQKVDKTNDLSNPVTSNSVPTTKESKVVENDKVIAPGMFRINPFKNSREEKYVPNKPTKASVRTNPITVSQPHVITKKVVNSDSNGFSSTGVDITTKTRRPQPRSNTKNDRVPSASKSSRIKNKEVEVEEHPRNLLLSKNKKLMSSECNNVKLAIWNDKSEIVCAMCKQCLITANHDVCVLCLNLWECMNLVLSLSIKRHMFEMLKIRRNIGQKSGNLKR